MLKLVGFFAEAAENGVELDYNTQIKMVFKTLLKDFVGFKAAYNLGNKELGLTELMRQLQAYELMINDGVPVQSKGKANLVVATSSGPLGNKKKKQKQRKQGASSSSIPPCHFKKTCKKFLTAKGKEGVQGNEKST
ncbi:hypothetical protein TIFTF001_049677 [Ficus carica]|uniref:Uncharacterized protein n=1 Tax=Ficus carica TaxID=3494 RepID=A0AA87ZAD3_FICCA|nr:hypothetical protein TIFTF001_049677 [Ficus carica]